MSTERKLPGILVLGVLVSLLGACGDNDGLVVAIGEEADSVVVTPPEARLEIGETFQFAATAYRGDRVDPSADVDWKSDDFAVATVDQDGVALGRSAGLAWIVASVDGVADSGRVTVDFVSTPPDAP